MRLLTKFQLFAFFVKKLIVIIGLNLFEFKPFVFFVVQKLLKHVRLVLTVFFEVIFLLEDFNRIILLNEPRIIPVLAIEVVLELFGIHVNIVIVSLPNLLPRETTRLVIFKFS